MNKNIFYLLAVLAFVACNKPKRYCPTTVSGRLWNTATNTPIAGAHVYIFETEFTAFLLNLNNRPRGYVGSTLTDENGNYTFTFEAVSNVKDLEYTVAVDREEIGSFITVIKDYATNPPTIINLNNYIRAASFWIAGIQYRCKNNYVYFDRAIGKRIYIEFYNSFATPSSTDSIALQVINPYFSYIALHAKGINPYVVGGLGYFSNGFGVNVITGTNQLKLKVYKNNTYYEYDTTIYVLPKQNYNLMFHY